MFEKLHKPYIVYHTITEQNANVVGDLLSNACKQGLIADYFQIHQEFKIKAFLCDCKTLQDRYIVDATKDIARFGLWHMDREDYVPIHKKENYVVSVDETCSLRSDVSYINDIRLGDSNSYIIEVLCNNASDDFLAYLQAYNIAYIFAGNDTIDYALAMHKLKTLFDIDVLLLEDNGEVGMALIEQGYVDEYSLVMPSQSDRSIVPDYLARMAYEFVEHRQLTGSKWLYMAKDATNAIFKRNNNAKCTSEAEVSSHDSESAITIDSPHDVLKYAILKECRALGYDAFEEYRGKDWRADVYVEANGQKFAFEVQVTHQSLRKTYERQAKYNRDGVICCWLFERESRNMKKEFEELPLFKFCQISNSDFEVSLKGRKKLPLADFVRDFLNKRIRFCQHIKRSSIVDVKFLRMNCHKCGAENYIYHIWPLKSVCNAELNYEDDLWVSDKFMFHPDIVRKVKEYVNSDSGKHLPMGEIKERYSGMVGHSYMSFGCCKCDAIFGDYYVKEAILFSSTYSEDVVDRMEIEVNAEETMQEIFPHWCHPGDLDFCE